MKYLCDSNDKRSCLCCGRIYKIRGKKCLNPAEAAAGLSALHDLGYSDEELLGRYKANLDWQAPGLSDFIRRGLQ
jgi:hypothetical protein